MILTTNYVDIAGSIEHVNVSKYLTDLGWKVLNTNNKRVKIFQLDNDGRLFQVNLPIDKELCDYKYAMYNAVLEIAASSNKSVEQVILELTNPLSDVIRLRIVDKDILVGKTAVPYINPQTKEIWYELVDRPLTQEEVLGQLVDRLEAKIDALSAAVAKMQGGAVEPVGKG